MIEDIIKANTAALIENTAALREILSVGASTAAVQAVPANKKLKKAEQAIALQEKLGEMRETEIQVKTTQANSEPELAASDIGTFRGHLIGENLPDTGQGVNPNYTTSEPEPTAPAVPNLPPTELRAKLKEEIKLRIMGDPGFKNHFDACREKYGVALVKDLTDDQLPAFYAEVLAV